MDSNFWLCDYVLNGRGYILHTEEYISKHTYLNYLNNPTKHIRPIMSLEYKNYVLGKITK